MFALLGIVLGTFASEDLTCIATGLLIQRGQVGVSAGIFACTIGIFAGDVGLWAIGRVFGRAALAWPWTARRLRTQKVEDAHDWLTHHAAGAIVASRFLPGTRFALYVMSGVLRLHGAVFALWAFVGALLWTPTIVLLTATLGDAFVGRIAPLVGVGWTSRIIVAAAIVVALHVGRTLASSEPRRTRLAARLARWRRWEFWPMWVFYAPVAAWIGCLALWHRGLPTITAANPGMPDGGLVGESKFDILAKLPQDAVIPSARLAPAAVDDRVSTLRAVADAKGWSLPFVLKPDVGQRGVGVRLARSWDDARTYLDAVMDAVLAQPYHAGPFEAGIYYYRMPGATCGRILSITDKQFPVLVGDGRSTIEMLIWTHPRYRLQADTFVARHSHKLARVPAYGECFPLAIAGNHCQGTTFRDGRHLMTPALERRIDEIAHAYPGFFVGRFDVRYADVDRFMSGADLAIVELNGVTAESTNIYDPSGSLRFAYRVLFQQWSIIFAIGAANRRAGATISSSRRLIELVRVHLRRNVACAISD
jgi:membrane protein DedA with SNARE-associated domain